MQERFKSQIHRAYTNIALVKYWGKRNEDLFLPVTSSLSLTLEAFFTESQVTFDQAYKSDKLILNGVDQGQAESAKIGRFLDLFRNKVGISHKAHVTSYNHVPTAAGLASSASAYAALSLACSDALGMDLSPKQLSIYARQGSGSATRSLFGGFVIWHKGQGDISETSYGEQIDPADWDIGMLVAHVDQSRKKISSTQGMKHTVQTSPFYQLWPQEVERDLALVKEAIKNKDIDLLGKTAEHNAMKMHATMISSYPSVNYFQSKSIEVINKVFKLRQKGLSVYYTMDAGPNVKVIAPLSIMDEVKGELSPILGPDKITLSRPGPSPHTVERFFKEDLNV